MNNGKKDRNASLDTIAGLLIIHMIILHCIQNVIGNLGIYKIVANLLFFFMPWFFFKNGMFIKSNTNINWQKEINRLIKPFMIFSTIGFITFAFNAYYIQKTSLWEYSLKSIYGLLKNGSLQGNLPLWFLFSLFLARVIFIQVRLWLSTPIIASISLIIAILFSHCNFHNIGWVANLPACISFLAMGKWFNKYQYNKYLLIISIILFVIIQLRYLSLVDIHGNMLKQGNYVVWWISSICGIVIINNLFKYINIHILSAIGNSSMTYYVWHWIIMQMLIFACYMFNIENKWLCLWIVLCGEIFLISVLFFKNKHPYYDTTEH